jgi:NAD-dependent deacetylase
MKKKLVIITGAGISADSGIKTFRDVGGLWEGYKIQDVATPEGWYRNPQLVLDFYNQRRRQLHDVQPNDGHLILAALEKDFDVEIITQNVDNLHEKARSSKVLHLHGELLKVRSTVDQTIVLDWETDLFLGDTDHNYNQLRPHIVWFGEEVPALEQAISMIEKADIIIIIGTSLQVYPAAGLLDYSAENIPLYYIDPKPAPINSKQYNLKIIESNAADGMRIVQNELNNLRSEV